MKTVYLAGKVHGRKRDVVPKHTHIEYVSSDGGNDWDHGFSGNHTDEKPINAPWMADMIKEMFVGVIKKADCLFAYLDTPSSYGSIAEIAYASALGIPCMVAILGKQPADNDEYDDIDDDDRYGLDNEPMRDAYWFVSNFPGVYSAWVETEDQATALFTRYIGYVLAESPIENAMWTAFLELIRFPYDELSLPVPQYQLNGYRLDFAWPEHKVAVEVDGHDYHKTKEQRSYDAKRDRELIKKGWTTLRFTGSDVHKDADAVADEVIQILLAGTGV